MHPLAKEQMPPGVVPPKTARTTATARPQGKRKANDENIDARDENDTGIGRKERPAKKNQKVSNGAALAGEKQIGTDKVSKKKKTPLQTITQARSPEENTSVDTPTPATETTTVETTSTEVPNLAPLPTGAGNDVMLIQIMSMMKDIKSKR